MSKTLYVMAIKGIQDYILGTTKLKEMAGASDLVECLPKGVLSGLLSGIEGGYTTLSTSAGGARILFDDEEQARRVARLWPMIAARRAPGLEIVQAIVPLGDGGLPDALEKAGERMMIHRNLPPTPIPPPVPAMKRIPRTGRPAAMFHKGEAVDWETFVKLQQDRGQKESLLASVFEDPTLRNANQWAMDFEEIADDGYLAIVHADANGLGSKMLALLDRLKKRPLDVAGKVYQDVCESVQQATYAAFRKAFEKVRTSCFRMRLLICAGDDMTAVMRARDAIEFTREYLIAFSATTKEMLARSGGEDFKDGLTACAGIAFVKQNYPFFQAYELCESLCSHAKNRTDRKLSALAFHRVTTSLSGSYKDDILPKVLQTGKLTLTMNPYVVEDPAGKHPTIDQLMGLIGATRKLPRGAVRSFVTRIHAGQDLAGEHYGRLRQVQSGRQLGEWKDFESALNNLTPLPAPESPLWLRPSNDGPITPVNDVVELIALKVGDDRESSKS